MKPSIEHLRVVYVIVKLGEPVPKPVVTTFTVGKGGYCVTDDAKFGFTKDDGVSVRHQTFVAWSVCVDNPLMIAQAKHRVLIAAFDVLHNTASAAKAAASQCVYLASDANDEVVKLTKPKRNTKW